MKIFGLTLGVTDLWLLGGVGLLLSWLVPYRLSISRDVIARRRTAAAAIAAAFRPELTAALQGDGDVGRYILTEAAHKKHEAAIIANIGALTWFQRLRLRQAWRRLSTYSGGSGHVYRDYSQYTDNGALQKRRAIRPIVIARLQRIVSIVE